jgi:hypothetical protein
MTTDYSDFIGSKRVATPTAGFDPGDLDRYDLFPFQRACVRWACERGRAALFADTGLGKSRMQLAWAAEVVRHTKGRVLVLAPLAVGPQTVREAAAAGVSGVVFARSPDEAGAAVIVVTNYDNLDKWEGWGEAGVVLDESSILKSFMGRTQASLTARFAATRYRLCCTATPAPNDYTEIGTHAAFIGVCSRAEMLAVYFINDVDGDDGGKTANEWRLKGHAVEPFWEWVASWARMVGVPSDIGDYDDTRYVLPPLTVHRHVVAVDIVDGRDTTLFRMGSGSATEIKREQRRTAPARATEVAAIVATDPGPWLIWIDSDADGDEVAKLLPDLVEVHGSDAPSVKEERLLAFADGRCRILMTKGSIAGMGLNFQVCAHQVFMGLTYSYERFYQQIRRSWRFGQERQVNVHVVIATTETPLLASIQRKQDDHATMKAQMFAASRRAQSRTASRGDYHPTHDARLPTWLESK